MTEVIYLRVGNSSDITLPALVDSLTQFKVLLQNFDAALAERVGGLVEWEVVSLQKSSPTILGVRPRSRYKKRPLPPEHISRVEDDVLENLALLRTGTDRTRYMSDDSLLRVERLAKRSEKLGPMLVYTGTPKSPKSSEINAKTLANIKELTSTSYSAFGSISGVLQSISVRKGLEFRIWEKASNKPVSCMFSKTQPDEIVTRLLRKEVEVSGLVDFNNKGTPVRVHIEGDYPAEIGRVDYPTIAEMKGLIHDFTGGATLKEYLEEISDE